MVAYQLHGTGRTAEDYRLLTTLTDARRYPARQLAALYHERWEAEAVFAELKAHQRGARVVLTSKTPDGVLQQIWAHLSMWASSSNGCRSERTTPGVRGERC